MNRDFKIEPLKDVPHVIPHLINLFIKEWEPYYGLAGPGNPEEDIKECCNIGKIPLALVALNEKGLVLGTVALKPYSLETHKNLGPWLAAFVVDQNHRNKAIGSALVKALEKKAKKMGYKTIFTGTNTAINLLERLGWEELKEGNSKSSSLRGPIKVYQKSL